MSHQWVVLASLPVALGGELIRHKSGKVNLSLQALFKGISSVVLYLLYSVETYLILTMDYNTCPKTFKTQFSLIWFNIFFQDQLLGQWKRAIGCINFNLYFDNQVRLYSNEDIGCQAGSIETCGYPHYWWTGVSA